MFFIEEKEGQKKKKRVCYEMRDFNIFNWGILPIDN